MLAALLLPCAQADWPTMEQDLWPGDKDVLRSMHEPGPNALVPPSSDEGTNGPVTRPHNYTNNGPITRPQLRQNSSTTPAADSSAVRPAQPTRNRTLPNGAGQQVHTPKPRNATAPNGSARALEEAKAKALAKARADAAAKAKALAEAVAKAKAEADKRAQAKSEAYAKAKAHAEEVQAAKKHNSEIVRKLKEEARADAANKEADAMRRQAEAAKKEAAKKEAVAKAETEVKAASSDFAKALTNATDITWVTNTSIIRPDGKEESRPDGKPTYVKPPMPPKASETAKPSTTRAKEMIEANRNLKPEAEPVRPAIPSRAQSPRPTDAEIVRKMKEQPTKEAEAKEAAKEAKEQAFAKAAKEEEANRYAKPQGQPGNDGAGPNAKPQGGAEDVHPSAPARTESPRPSLSRSEERIDPLVARRDPEPANPADILVVSMGGLGSTITELELLSVPQLKGRLVTDRELKHLPFQRLVQHHAFNNGSLAHVKRILYLWGEPTHAVKSIYRRNYQIYMAQRMRSDSFESSNSFASEDAFFATPQGIEEYAAAGHDVFEMQKHIESYLNPHPGPFQPKVAFLQLEKKTHHLGMLASFLGVGPNEQRSDTAHDQLTKSLEMWLSPWEVTSRAEVGAENQLGMGEHTIHGKAAMLYADQVTTIETSIATLAMTLVRTGALWYTGNELTVEGEYRLSQPLEDKISSKFANLKAVMYGFLAAHDGFFVRRENEEPHIFHDSPPAKWATASRPTTKNWKAHGPSQEVV